MIANFAAADQAYRVAEARVTSIAARQREFLTGRPAGTRQIDSAGLGALMLVQRKAAERRLTVCLRGANEELRFLLVLTKLDDLFELESSPS